MVRSASAGIRVGLMLSGCPTVRHGDQRLQLEGPLALAPGEPATGRGPVPGPAAAPAAPAGRPFNLTAARLWAGRALQIPGAAVPTPPGVDQPPGP